MDNLETLEGVLNYTKQLRKQQRLNAQRVHAGQICDNLEAGHFEPAEFVEREGFIFQLDRVEKNTASKCPNRHNSNIAIYKLVEGALYYDFS